MKKLATLTIAAGLLGGGLLTTLPAAGSTLITVGWDLNGDGALSGADAMTLDFFSGETKTLSLLMSMDAATVPLTGFGVSYSFDGSVFDGTVATQGADWILFFDQSSGPGNVAAQGSTFLSPPVKGDDILLFTADWTATGAAGLNTLLSGAVIADQFIDDTGHIVDDSVGFLGGQELAVVPIPAAAWLFGSALLGGGLIGSRRKLQRRG